jgi:hypothetical protein
MPDVEEPVEAITTFSKNLDDVNRCDDDSRPVALYHQGTNMKARMAL